MKATLQSLAVRKRAWLKLTCLFLIAISATAAISAPNNNEGISAPAKIVLIIDDMGNSLDLGHRAISLHGAINYAFLPHRPHSKSLAKLAHKQTKEILLHLPMSNLSDNPTGAGTLKPSMNRQQFLNELHANIASVPHVKGLNNHTGSLLTQLRQPMDWLMSSLKQQQLYFIDSRTSPRTVAAKIATQHHLPILKRDVFLDNIREKSAIDKQFRRLIDLAKKQGVAVAIGHPYPETLAYLEDMLPRLADMGITLTRASDLLEVQECQQNGGCTNKINVAKNQSTKHLSQTKERLINL